jgi:hypothetical protein
MQRTVPLILHGMKNLCVARDTVKLTTCPRLGERGLPLGSRATLVLHRQMQRPEAPEPATAVQFDRRWLAAGCNVAMAVVRNRIKLAAVCSPAAPTS